MIRAAFILTLAASPLAAETCPEAPDHAAEIDALIAEVQAAPNEMKGREISSRMWEFWADAPDEPAQSLLDSGMQARSSYNFTTALDKFDRLIAYCPDYAEGYNQRAFVYYLNQEFAAALPDLDRTLELSPNHVAALAGKALTLMGLGRHEEAQETLRAAVALNPWISERHLLEEPPGTDL